MKRRKLPKIPSQGDLTGLTLIKLLAVILSAGFIMVASALVLNINRMNGRDAVRVKNIATIKLALITYGQDSATGYPGSTGECLKNGSGVGNELLGAKVLLDVPVDPLWPTAAPAQTSGVPNSDQTNFCYFYYSSAGDQYKISFFLESNSQTGQAGVNTTTQ